MPAKGKVTRTRRAKYGEKMIQITLYFWTNDIAKQRNKIRPKHGRTAGMVRVEASKTHGIRAGKAIPFNSLGALPGVIEKAIIQHGIILHRSRAMKRYLSP
jgi:hypothetical protein